MSLSRPNTERPRLRILAHVMDLARATNFHTCRLTFPQQQVDDLLRTAITEKLSQRFFVIGDAVAFHQRDEVCGCLTSERRLTEVRVRGNKVIGSRVNISEVAPPAAGNPDLLADRF